MKNKIVFLDADTVGDHTNLELFNELGKYTQYELTSPEQIIERIGDNEIVITNKAYMGKEVMDACPKLKLICIAATGMNNVDLGYADQKGLEVKNVAGYSTESVAQSAFSMLFYLLHNSRYLDEYVKSGTYQKSPIFTFHGKNFWELKDKNFGVVGLGAIGKRVAEIASAFGSKVSYYSSSGKNSNSKYPQLSLHDLLSSSDVVSIHCPLNDRTQNLIGKKELQLMKPNAYLLNLGRGGIVNEQALSDALENELIEGAGIDVLTKEPIAIDNPLLSCMKPDKLFITPHTAWASIESRRLLIQKIAENIRAFLK